MSGYSEQGSPYVHRPYTPEAVKHLSMSAARCLLQQAQEKGPESAEHHFLLNAVVDKHRITFQQHNGQVINYDDIVGEAWQHIETEDPLREAFASLVLKSLQPEDAQVANSG